MKNRKRIAALLLAVIMVLGLTACDGSTSSKNSEKSLYEYGMDMIESMRQIADSEATLAMLLLSINGPEPDVNFKSDLVNMMAMEPISSLAHMYPSNLERVYQIEISSEAYWNHLLSQLDEIGIDADQTLSEMVEKYQKSATSILSNIGISLLYNSLVHGYGYSASYYSMFQTAFYSSTPRTLVNDKLEKDTVYLYIFDDIAVMVMFSKVTEETVNASALPMLTDEIIDGSRSEIKQLLMDQIGENYIDIDVKDITP
ncbi:MAG: hypothetical protein K2N41_09940 [Lachnospiraceae bacterium]|nr:hypothetical protein [Lachnospiraceae bacterium]MDE7240014.1 hypothetical protein [Lachnospiraceae bacterium]